MARDTARQPDVIAANENERAALDRVQQLLDDEGTASLVGSGGEAIPLPVSMRRALEQVAHNLAQGRSVSVVASDDELTTQEAAEMLRVSRPYLVKLLEAGEIPFVKTGAHRRIRTDDLLAYKRRRDAGRRQALTRLTEMSQELGLYGAEQ